MKRLVIAIFVLGAAAGAYWWFRGRSSPSEAQPLNTVPVQRTTIVSEVAASGTVDAARQLNLTFRTPGQVRSVLVNEGDTVAQGQLLAELDTAELDLQLRQAEAGLALAQAQFGKVTAGPAQADVAAAQAALDSAIAAYSRVLQGPTEEQRIVAEAQLRKAEVAVAQAQSAYDQVKWIGGVAALPQSLALQAATTDLEAARANYASATRDAEDRDVRAADAQVAQARANLARLTQGAGDADLAVGAAQLEQARIGVEQAQLALDNARLLAPFGGVIAASPLVVGQTVSGAVPAFTLVDNSALHIGVSIDEADIGLVQVGQAARIEPEPFPGVSLRGHVAQIGSVPVSQASGVVQYAIRIDVDDQLPGLRDGMTAQVVLEVLRHENVIVVPNVAVQVDRGSGITYVEKLVQGTPVASEVILGAAGDGITEVLAGLSDGDTVVERTESSRQQLRGVFSGQGQ